MPLDATTGQAIPFTADEVAAMEIKTFGVRDFSHPVESRRVNENVMTRPFFCKWSERFNFVEHVLGRSVTWNDSGTTKLSRLLPDSTFGRHPDSLQIIATRIDDIRGHGVGTDDINGMPAYSKAIVTVFYEQAAWRLLNDNAIDNERQRFVSISRTTESDSEAFTLPGAAFKYVVAGGGAPHGTPVPFNVSILRHIERFILWWEQVPFTLLSDSGALYRRLYFGENLGGAAGEVPLIGTVNDRELLVTSCGQRYAAGKLLLEGVVREFEMHPLALSGTSGWRYRVGFKYAFTPRGWLNLFLFNPGAPGTSGYYQVTNNGLHYPDLTIMQDFTGLYNCRDHNLLFSANF